MIYGIQAAQPDSGGAGGNPYPDSLAVCDFVLGEYWMGDSEVTAASMVDRPDLIVASGLRIQGTVSGGVVFIIGALSTLLFTANYTLVLEWSDDDAGAHSRYPFEVDDSSTAGGLDHLFVFFDNSMVGFYDQPDPGTNRLAEKTGLPAMPATRRIAATRVNAGISLSVNGTAVITDMTPTSPISLDVATFGGTFEDAYPGGFASMNGHIRRLIIYAAQADAALPGLSTP